VSIVFYSSGNKNLASVRIRILKIIDCLPDAHHTTDINRITNKDIVIVPKTQPPSIMRAIKSKCSCLFWDVCDNYFADGRRKVALDMLDICDKVICTTEAMKSIILSENKNKEIYIIEDPVYYNFTKPSFLMHKDRIKLVWYGNHFNLSHADWNKMVFDPISKSFDNVEITFVTNTCKMPKGCDKIKHKFVPWSVDSQEKEVIQSDFVILPVDHQKPAVKVKSHNKLVDGLACGTMVLCSPQDSYLNFSDYAYVNNDFVGSIQNCIQNPIETISKIQSGQTFIKDKFTNKILANKLLSII